MKKTKRFTIAKKRSKGGFIHLTDGDGNVFAVQKSAFPAAENARKGKSCEVEFDSTSEGLPAVPVSSFKLHEAAGQRFATSEA